MLMAAPADSGTPRTVGRLGSSYEVSYGTGDVLIIVDPRRTVRRPIRLYTEHLNVNFGPNS